MRLRLQNITWINTVPCAGLDNLLACYRAKLTIRFNGIIDDQFLESSTMT